MKKYIKSFNGFINEDYKSEFKDRKSINDYRSINEEKSVADVINKYYPYGLYGINLLKNGLDFSRKELTSLEGSPNEMEWIMIYYNKLKNLIGGPKKIKYYYADHNRLESLEGSPERVISFGVSYNKLKNLINGPKKADSYYARHNKLETLEGAPNEVGIFDISDNPTLKDTDGIPKRIEKLYLQNTIHSTSQFTEYPEYVDEIYFDTKISIEDVKEIISNIKEVKYVYVGSKKYTKDEILNM